MMAMHVDKSGIVLYTRYQASYILIYNVYALPNGSKIGLVISGLQRPGSIFKHI